MRYQSHTYFAAEDFGAIVILMTRTNASRLDRSRRARYVHRRGERDGEFNDRGHATVGDYLCVFENGAFSGNDYVCRRIHANTTRTREGDRRSTEDLVVLASSDVDTWRRQDVDRG